jgi:hypothetical protein
MDARGIGHDVLAVAEETAEKSQRHGTAANVACTDKKNVFHGAVAAACKVKSNSVKSTNPALDCPKIDLRSL